MNLSYWKNSSSFFETGVWLQFCFGTVSWFWSLFLSYHPTIKPLGAARIGKKGRATEDALKRAMNIVILQKNMKEKNMKQFFAFIVEFNISVILLSSSYLYSWRCMLSPFPLSPASPEISLWRFWIDIIFCSNQPWEWFLRIWNVHDLNIHLLLKGKDDIISIKYTSAVVLKRVALDVNM